MKFTKTEKQDLVNKLINYIENRRIYLINGMCEEWKEENYEEYTEHKQLLKTTFDKIGFLTDGWLIIDTKWILSKYEYTIRKAIHKRCRNLYDADIIDIINSLEPDLNRKMDIFSIVAKKCEEKLLSYIIDE